MKHLLRRILSKACINYDDMLTILCECEAIVNSRPLTYISSDCDDLTHLTPSMFLQEVREIGTRNTGFRHSGRYRSSRKDAILSEIKK